jgi:hypothetical protein
MAVDYAATVCRQVTAQQNLAPSLNKSGLGNTLIDGAVSNRVCVGKNLRDNREWRAESIYHVTFWRVSSLRSIQHQDAVEALRVTRISHRDREVGGDNIAA